MHVIIGLSMQRGNAMRQSIRLKVLLLFSAVVIALNVAVTFWGAYDMMLVQ